MSTPAGWYPNPDGTPSQRWWDGQRWSEHVNTPAAQQTFAPVAQPGYARAPHDAFTPAAQPGYAAALQAPAGTSASTVPFWLFALAPLLSLLTFAVFDLRRYAELSAGIGLEGVSSGTELLSAIASTGYFNVFLVSFGLWVVSIVLAAVDSSVLKRRGVPRPFGWGWTFLSPIIYLIGRPVVASRRGARGSRGAVIAFIIVNVLVFVVSMVISVSEIGPLMSQLSSTYGSYSS